jgi:hypothetical protein
MKISFVPGSSRSMAVRGGLSRCDRLMMTPYCGSALIKHCDRPRSVREDCQLARNRTERLYGGSFLMSGSNSWQQTPPGDPMILSGPPS